MAAAGFVMSSYPSAVAMGGVNIALAQRAVLPVAIGGVKAAVARRAALQAASQLGFSNASQFTGTEICGRAGLDSKDLLKSTLRVNAPPFRLQPVARRVCPLTGKKSNRANIISNANNKTKKQQFVNLQYKRLWWEAGKRFVKLRLSTKALKTIEKHGLDVMAKKAGIDLSKK